MSDDTKKTRVINRPIDRLQGPASAESPPDYDKTNLIGRDLDHTTPMRPPPIAPQNTGDQGKTVLFRPPSKSAGGEAGFNPLAPASREKDAGSKDPVVGWVVIVKGPGRGNAIQLGYGWNSIGRDSSQRVSLDFGDDQVSRLNHAKLLYDPRARKFTLTLGEGTNPTYVRGEALLAPTEIHTGDRIQIGDTELLFLGLCGADFEWNDDV